MFHRFRRGCLLACGLVLPLSGQSGSGVVSGHVLDSDQAPLAGVEAQLINLRSAQVLRRQTGSDGAFEFAALAAGRYSLMLVRERYQAWRSNPFEVLPGIPVAVPPVVLRRLAASSTLPRSGFEEIGLEHGLVREQVEALPIVVGAEGRTTVDKLLHLVPGITPANAIDINPFSGRAALVSANGARSSFINYKLDGASNNAQNRITGAQAATLGPPPEALESLRVITHTYSARDGRNAGAVVDPLFRAGGAQWHGQARGFVRPPWSESSGSFDGARDRVGGWTGGAQLGGPVSKRHELYGFFDGEAWLTDRRHDALRRGLSENERSGNFFGFENQPIDPLDGLPFPNGKIPRHRLDPLMQHYLDTFVPPANLERGWMQLAEDLPSHGHVALARIDRRSRRLAHYFSHYLYSNRVKEPPRESFTVSPGTVADRYQLSNHSQYAITHTMARSFAQTLRLGIQRLSSDEQIGNPRYRTTAAEDLGFEYGDLNPRSLPDVRLWNDFGQLQLHVAPYIHAEDSVQTTLQLSHAMGFRWRRQTVRAGLLMQRGSWPFTNRENAAGSFSFPAPPNPPVRFRGQGLRDLLLGRPAEFRLQSDRSLDLRWHEFAAFVEGELRPVRDLKVTVGLRFEQQPPGIDRLDRLMTFREGTQSVRFPESLPNLLFPGDTAPDGSVLSRSTIDTLGRNLSPRVGIAFSPAWKGPVARWVLGESGRSVFRGAYGVFFDHGTFAGSSAAALFQATYPPFSTDNRYTLRNPDGMFQAPGTLIGDTALTTIRSRIVRYPILVFDPQFENARAEHWNLSWQRLLPWRIFLSGTYLGTHSSRLQRQRELNGFVRNPLHSFGFVRYMRRYSRFSNIRSFESSGTARYRGIQLRANRYLQRGLALDIGYNWSRSFDDGSTVLGNDLVGAAWTHSDFDRRHSLTAIWLYEVQLPQRWVDRLPWTDRWTVSGIWRWRSGLPLDIRQTQDPSYTFAQVGRPDRIGDFKRLDTNQIRTFALDGERLVTGHFAFDPTAFRAVRPTSFEEVRQGSSGRNEYRMSGFQQWDLRITRVFQTAEKVSTELGVDLLNAFGNRNWAEPFGNIDHVYFGVARMSGLGRTTQVALRLRF